MVYFQANADSPIFPDLRGLLLKTAGLIDVLADALKPVAAKMQVAFVYGSIAGGSERSDSDIDLMLVGTQTPAELALPLRRARELLGRDINPTVYTPVEFRKKQTAKEHFLTRVLDKPKLFVIGTLVELEKLIE
jgi:predicted nucleotidyltransferase